MNSHLQPRLENPTPFDARSARPRRSGFVAGVAVGALALASVLAVVRSDGQSGGDDSMAAAGLAGTVGSLLSAIGSQATADFGEGEFIFLPNRRTIWVIHPETGRFANYHFRADQEKSVLRSRIVTLNTVDFPPEDTEFLLSDRNLTESLWVCNKQTGDVQLWHPRSDGNVVLEGQIVTADLRGEAK